MNMLETFGKTRAQQITVLVFISIGLSLFILNLLVFTFEERIKSIINLFASLLIIIPTFLMRYYIYRKEREIESRFPDFLRDVVDAINSGMTLPQAIKHVMDNDYGALSKYVKQIGAQIDWGIPFEKVLRNFGKKIGNKVIKRAISTIIETHRSGGRISDTLLTVTETLIEINKIRKERLAYIYSQILSGYIIFFVFLGIMISIIKFLLPGMLLPGIEEISTAQRIDTEFYKEMFLYLILIEGAFSGIAIGKMSEGTIIAGLKHSLILCSIGYAVFVLMG
ncbi:MAG TPA: type II secretion system F family protein [Nanoarchaeota archaeon]|nr:type II secretion system F family protein [Nanoarchaeota archaeon]